MSMVKWLDYPLATTEVGGSNPRRVNFNLNFLISFSFRYPSEAGESTYLYIHPVLLVRTFSCPRGGLKTVVRFYAVLTLGFCCRSRSRSKFDYLN